MYSLNYREQEVITAAGEYKGVAYGAQKLIVDAAAYLNFPREPVAGLDDESHPLIKILRAGVPIDEAALKDWSEEAAVGALRLAFGQMTWRQAVEDMATINQIVTNNFKDSDGALIKAGFRVPGIRLVVTEIHLPRELEEAMVGPDRIRLKVDAAANVAKQRAIETFGAVLETIAHATGKELTTIKAEFEKDPAKAFKIYRGFLPRGFDVADFVKLAQLLQNNAVFEFRTPDIKDGMTGGLMAAIALLRKMDGSGGGAGKPGEPAMGREKPRFLDEMTREERVEELKRRAGDRARG